MSTVLTAQPTIYLAPTCIRNVAVSFVADLTAGELLTGTPTVTISGGASVSNKTINAATMLMEIPDNKHYAKAGQAVTFTLTAASATPGPYTVTITCPTVGGQVLPAYLTIVVSAS